VTPGGRCDELEVHRIVEALAATGYANRALLD